MKAESKNFERLNQIDFIARLQAGDETAYRELDKELFPFFRNFSQKEYGLSEEEAKDLVQETALVIYEKISLFDTTKGRLETWAFQILRNRCVDWLRSRRKYKWIAIEELPEDVVNQMEETRSPKDHLSPLERLPFEVRQAILRLPDRYQQFLGLFLLGVHDEHVMNILKIKTHSAFRSLKSRIFAKLKAELKNSK